VLLSSIFQLYRGGQLYCCMKPEYPEKTTDVLHVHNIQYWLRLLVVQLLSPQEQVHNEQIWCINNNVKTVLGIVQEKKLYKGCKSRGTPHKFHIKPHFKQICWSYFYAILMTFLTLSFCILN
jgi:hypothetical protein